MTEIPQPITLPIESVVKLGKQQGLITLGEYVMPHACSWVYANLKDILYWVAFDHEFRAHPSLGGSWFAEARKIACLETLSQSEKEEERIFREQLEGLCGIEAILQTRFENRDPRTFEILVEDTASAAVYLFKKIHDILSEKVAYEELWVILRDLYLQLARVGSEDKGPVPPLMILDGLAGKLEQNLQEMNRYVFVEIFHQLLRENDWVTDTPIRTHVCYSLGWLSILNSTPFQKIALRNFFELALLIPINTCFIVYADPVFVQRLPSTAMIRRVKLPRKPTSPLGIFLHHLTEKAQVLATNLENDPLGEERWLLHYLPSLASSYVGGLVKDYESTNPVLFSRDYWKVIAETTFPTFKEPLGEIIRSYDDKIFEDKVKGLIADTLYLAEDCVDIVEKRAEEVYESFGDLKDTLFDRPRSRLRTA